MILRLVARKKQRGIVGITPKDLYDKLGFKPGPVEDEFKSYSWNSAH